MTDKTGPTPGTKRAAKVLAKLTADGHPDLNWTPDKMAGLVDEIAQIIDEQTGAAAMLEALKYGNADYDYGPGKSFSWSEMSKKYLAAIAKAEGNQNESEDVN